VLGAGALGAFNTSVGTHLYTSQVAWTFDTTQMSGHLLAGFLDNVSFGSGFQQLEFSIHEEGNLLVDELFTSLAAATSYFADKVLDLGSFAATNELELVFGFALTATGAGDGFGMNFVFGAASEPIVLPPGAGGPGGGGGTEVPEPGMLALLGFAGAALVLVRRRGGAVRSGGA
jgi:hypothetical protein